MADEKQSSLEGKTPVTIGAAWGLGLAFAQC